MSPESIEAEIISYASHRVTPETPRIMRDVLESLRVQVECGATSLEFYRRMRDTVENSPHLKSA